ncbi:hypothetical protein HMPREF9997_01823 [Corynebacterium durum F0235]|uniref:Uncharacterized protein n=1 Tax=Corynebacterium durum F0235 TaxID=1035195 RepID=L1MDR5_9CORY|nr:hypothetical protein HMPREF9997_01823 [Corynebacterium durum F0235]
MICPCWKTPAHRSSTEHNYTVFVRRVYKCSALHNVLMPKHENRRFLGLGISKLACKQLH